MTSSHGPPEAFTAGSSPTAVTVHGSPILYCSDRTNHPDAVTPAHLAGDEPVATGLSATAFSSGLMERALCAAKANQRKGDPP
jgi:hypothetical protein